MKSTRLPGSQGTSVRVAFLLAKLRTTPWTLAGDCGGCHARGHPPRRPDSSAAPGPKAKKTKAKTKPKNAAPAGAAQRRGSTLEDEVHSLRNEADHWRDEVEGARMDANEVWLLFPPRWCTRLPSVPWGACGQKCRGLVCR